MFDYHLHTKVSFDSVEEPENVIKAAEKLGLREICFTDHYDFSSYPDAHHDLFDIDYYKKSYSALKSDKILIRRGVEFGLTEWNKKYLDELVSSVNFDFVIGSVHSVDGSDPYFKEYWEKAEGVDPYEKYLLQTLECVKAHDAFDVLGHINYVCKSPTNPIKIPLRYEDYSDICDEIMKALVSKGIGMEINTSGLDRIGEFLPNRAFIKRFRELGGEILTVGSDAHDVSRLGQCCTEAIEIAKDIFGYVCTFENRKPIFHRL